jgi:hypothetical protein
MLNIKHLTSLLNLLEILPRDAWKTEQMKICDDVEPLEEQANVRGEARLEQATGLSKSDAHVMHQCKV